MNAVQVKRATPQTSGVGQVRNLSDGISRRRGAILVAVMVCLLLVSLIGASLIRLGLTQYEQTRWDELQLQAAWLADSGVERAVAKLGQDTGYDGETWQVSLVHRGKESQASVQIQVQPIQGQPTQRRVTVAATYPAEGKRRAKVSKTQIVELKKVSGTVAGMARRVLRTTVPDTFFSLSKMQIVGERS